MHAFTKRRCARVAVLLWPCSTRWNWAKALGKTRQKKLKKPLTDYLRGKLSDGGHEARGLQPRRPAAVRWSAWLGRVRNLIDTPQKYIRVTEIREDTNSSLR